jgi:membrane protease YdiL (CAAX protease family)
MSGTSQRKAAALFEVLGVYLCGPVLMLELRRMLGVSLTNPLNHLTAQASGAELVTASRQLLVLLLVSNAGYYILAVPLNWWYRRRKPADFGLTKAGHTWKFLLLAGIGAAAVCEWPVLTLNLVNTLHPSATVAWRQAIFDMSWQRWQFWLFAGVLSWVGAPLFEELFYRGYCQRRLAEDWGDGPAIFGAACLFTFSHSQYLRLDPYNMSMTAGLLLSAIGFGAVFAWTRSLIPSMIAHSLFDIPMTLRWQVIFLAAIIVIALISVPRARVAVNKVFSGASATACAALAVIGAAYAVLNSVDRIVIYVVIAAIAMLILAIILEAKTRSARGWTRESRGAIESAEAGKR